MHSRRWVAPPIVLGLGWLALLGIQSQTSMGLRGDLRSVFPTFEDYRVQDVAIPEAERRVAGMTDYLMRVFERDSAQLFSVYVGYYESQRQGRSIHSPKNCLPGGGWEPVSSGTREVRLRANTVTINRYLIAKGGLQAVVYYWYQGRGRVAWNEYAVKWDLLRDKALHRRSDEALVRIVVPFGPAGPDGADSLATHVAAELAGQLDDVLPASPEMAH